ncbi:HAMP domain-containing histidine kinase [Candidatus Woesearchaeota archaeon]|nr:HAMP domain-containing histidine kinase [Candidatus Woesearchaeota archaeon]
MVLIEAYHAFFAFLGTIKGDLLKRFIELVFFTIVSYMVTSEWTRDKRTELRYLIIAFGTLAAEKLFSTIFLFLIVFGKIGMNYADSIMYFEHIVDIFAVMLLGSAFLYPILKQKSISLRNFLKHKTPLLIAISLIASLALYSFLDLLGRPLSNWYCSPFLFAKILILFYCAAYIQFNKKYELKYRGNIQLAFIVFAITSLLDLINVIFYDFTATRLAIAGYPFPFISILLFTQVTFLKVVDKATLKEQLKLSKEKYIEEKHISSLKDEFVSVISHELKTPLTSMKLYISMLKNKKLGKLSSKQEEALKIIREESDRLGDLINDVLDLSKLESKKVSLKKEKFNLHELVNDKLYFGIAKEKNIEVINDVPKELEVCGDRKKIKQVFINLFTNAVKFTESRGKITMGSEIGDNFWKFLIQDNGKGIEKEKIPNLFDRFYQADDFMTRKAGGVGLGLAIVKNIVDLHKGSINVESDLGRGTKFTLTFPNQ